MIRVALASAGYEVLETTDGESALASCANHDGAIQLLVTDVVLQPNPVATAKRHSSYFRMNPLTRLFPI
jgi:hypothetical protein